MGTMGTLGLTCGNAAQPAGIIGGIDGDAGIIGADLRKLSALTKKPQVTPNVPNNPTGAANIPTAKPQVSPNIPNNPTQFVSTRARVRAGSSAHLLHPLRDTHQPRQAEATAAASTARGTTGPGDAA
jgi:hypothetical protein